MTITQPALDGTIPAPKVPAARQRAEIARPPHRITWDAKYRKRTQQRVQANSTVTPTGCWVWTRAVDRDGYGIAGAPERSSAHRVAYLAFVGPIPDGLSLDHTCHTNDNSCLGGAACMHRRCVNPGHLEAVTGEENTLRGLSAWAQNARKTHCHRGHEFTPENTYQRSDGRACRACIRLASSSYRSKKQEISR
jgi:hypothetical protein